MFSGGKKHFIFKRFHPSSAPSKLEGLLSCNPVRDYRSVENFCSTLPAFRQECILLSFVGCIPNGMQNKFYALSTERIIPNGMNFQRT